MNKYTILALIGLVLVVALSAQVVKYKVNTDKCITCGYCVDSKICPTNAISMVKGKAVIDREKCIGCTLCKVGNRSNYVGCPVDAFGPEAKVENASPKVTPKVIDGKKVQSSAVQPQNTVAKANQNAEVNALVNNTMKTRSMTSVAVVSTPKTTTAATIAVATPTPTPVEAVVKFVVNAVKCVSCRLCVSACPVGAISMVNGKAVIDQAKCTGCGKCANGNGKDFKGCPVKAISPTK